MSQPIQENQIGEFYLEKDGGGTIQDNSLSNTTLKLERANASSTGNILEIQNLGSGLDILTDGGFSVSSTGSIVANSGSINGNLVVQNLTVNNNLILQDAITFNSGISVSGSLTVQNLFVSGTQYVSGSVIVQNNLNVLGNSNLNHLTTNSITNSTSLNNSGDLIVSGMSNFNQGVNFNNFVNFNSQTSVLDSLLIKTPTSPQLLVENDSSGDTQVHVKNNSPSNLIGDSGLIIESNDNPLSKSFIELTSNISDKYSIIFSPILDQVEFLADTTSDFESRFSSNLTDHNIVVEGNVTSTDDVVVQRNLNVNQKAVFNILESGNLQASSITTNKLVVSGSSSNPLLVENRTDISVGIPPTPGLYTVSNSFPYQLVFFNGQQPVLLTNIDYKGGFDSIVPYQYATPIAAINGGAKKILVLPGTYDDTVSGTLTVNTDFITIQGIETENTMWELNQVNWFGSGFNLSNITIKSGDLNFNGGGGHRWRDVILDNTKVTTLSNHSDFRLRDCVARNVGISLFDLGGSNFKVDGLEIESASVSTQNIILIENPTSDISLKRINSNASPGSVPFMLVSNLLTDFEFLDSEINNFGNLIRCRYDIVTTPVSGSLSDWRIRNVNYLNAGGAFYKFEIDTFPANFEVNIENLLISNCVLERTLLGDEGFCEIIGGNPDKPHRQLVFNNIISNRPNPSTLAVNNYHHFYINTSDTALGIYSKVENLNISDIVASGGSFLLLDSQGQNYNFNNISIEGNQETSIPDADYSNSYLFDIKCRSGFIANAVINNISGVTKHQGMGLFAATGADIRRISYTGFAVNHLSTRGDGANDRGVWDLNCNNGEIKGIFVGGGSARSSQTQGNIFSVRGTDSNGEGLVAGLIIDKDNAITLVDTNAWSEGDTVEL